MQLTVLDLEIFDSAQNLLIEKELGNQITNDRWILRFWQNNPCVILGRFQREEYEIIPQYLAENGIKLCRRETGGGTVYHDLGTLNVSIVKPINPPLRSKIKDATVCTEIIGSALKKLGLTININERNAIFIGENKILGSAAALTNGISHYHCSILYDTNLTHLINSINWNPIYNEDKNVFVKSHRSPVINLKTVLPTLSITHLKETILHETQLFLKTL
jgi:lipoate-protein ligase A